MVHTPLGGAVEITLLRKPVTESTSVTPGDTNTSFMELLGYLSLFGNTLCMVSLWADRSIQSYYVYEKFAKHACVFYSWICLYVFYFL